MKKANPTSKKFFEVPVTANPVTAAVDLTPEEIGARLPRFSVAERKNLLVTFSKYLRGDTALWEEKKLREAGLLAPLPTAEAPPVDTDTCDTFAELAARMTLHYQNPDKSSKLRISITKKTVSDWSQGKRLDGIPWPPKPLEGARRRWSLRAWLDWFNEHMWHDARISADQSNGASGSKMSLNELKEITERDRLEHERWKIVKEMGGYISVALAEQHAAGFSRQYHDLWKTRNEQTMIESFEIKAQSLNLPKEAVAVLKEFLVLEHQKFTDAVEVASEKFATELAEKLKAEIQRETGTA